MPSPKDPIKREEWLKNLRRRSQNPEWIRKNKENGQKCACDPEWRRKQKEAMVKRSQTPEWIRKNKETARKNIRNPEWHRKQSESHIKYFQDPGNLNKHKQSMQNRARDPEWICKLQKLMQNPEYRLKQKEGRLGGFWYGNVRYYDRKYCELWCPDLWHRIDEAQNYQSILSKKTRFDNGGRALDRHHVYYQKKACCEWDEDANGYYAWIDVGTVGKPNKIKYYIRGDPNKFVLLTKSEHAMVKKNKLKWIEMFENLIETKLGGVCYLPKVKE